MRNVRFFLGYSALIISSWVLLSAEGRVFTYGYIKNSVYYNSFFGMSIKIDKKWHVKDQKEFEKTMASGRKKIGEDDSVLTNLSQEQILSATLLNVFKYKIDSTVQYNPSLLIMVEKIDPSWSMKNSRDYLLTVKDFLGKSKVQYEFDDSIGEELIGDKSFKILHARIGNDSFAVYQNYYCAYTNQYSFNFIQSYSDEDQHSELEKMTSTMHFEKQ